MHHWLRDTLIEGFSHFVTSMTAPIASDWSDCRVGLAPTGKRRLVTAHAKNGSRVLLDHLIGERAGGNTKKEAPSLPAGRNRDDNWMVAERKFERRSEEHTSEL